MNLQNTFGQPKAGVSVKAAYTGTAGTTAAIPDAQVIRVMSTSDCFIEIGASPTAVADTGLYLPAFTPEYFNCSPGNKVSAIQVTASGTLYVTPF